jgi:hypothetical protein
LDIIIPNHEAETRTYLTEIFGDKEKIDFDMFKIFYEQDHTLEIIYYNKRIRMAMSLACLDDIEILYDNNLILQGSNVVNPKIIK